MRPGIITLGALVVLGAAAPAAAEDVPAAEALFHRGLAAMEAGRYAEACASLDESHRLDPRMGTLFTLAECRSKEGKVATAVALYDDYLSAFARLAPADQARQRARERVAGEKKRALGPRVPRLVLRLPPGVSASVTRDDVTLRPPALGIPLPVDPGEHQITTQVDRGAVHRQTITIGPDEEKVIVLEVVSPEGQAPAPLAGGPGPRAEDPPRPAAPGGSRRALVWVTGGLGAAALVVGVGTGAAVLVKKGTVTANCPGDVCTARGLEAANSARPLGTASTTGFVIGGLGLGTALILYLTDRPAAEPPVAGRWFRPVVAGVDAKGAWLGARGEW